MLRFSLADPPVAMLPRSSTSTTNCQQALLPGARLLVCDAPDCHHQAHSAGRRRAHWNTASVKWQTFIDAVEEPVGRFSPGPTPLSNGVQRFDLTLLAAAKRRVGKPKTWVTPEHRAAIERKNALCRSKATETETSKLQEAASQLK